MIKFKSAPWSVNIEKQKDRIFYEIRDIRKVSYINQEHEGNAKLIAKSPELFALATYVVNTYNQADEDETSQELLAQAINDLNLLLLEIIK